MKLVNLAPKSLCLHGNKLVIVTEKQTTMHVRCLWVASVAKDRFKARSIIKDTYIRKDAEVSILSVSRIENKVYLDDSSVLDKVLIES